MLICKNCKTEMTCLKNGFGARWHEAHYYHGDLYKCKKCGTEVITTNSTPVQNTVDLGISMTDPINHHEPKTGIYEVDKKVFIRVGAFGTDDLELIEKMPLNVVLSNGRNYPNVQVAYEKENQIWSLQQELLELTLNE